jgi:hypothetical protein
LIFGNGIVWLKIMIERVIRGAEIKNSRLVARHTHGNGPCGHLRRNRGRTAYQKDQRDENGQEQTAKRKERFITHETPPEKGFMVMNGQFYANVLLLLEQYNLTGFCRQQERIGLIRSDLFDQDRLKLSFFLFGEFDLLACFLLSVIKYTFKNLKVHYIYLKTFSGGVYGTAKTFR